MNMDESWWKWIRVTFYLYWFFDSCAFFSWECLSVCFCLFIAQNINHYRAKNEDSWEPSHESAISGWKLFISDKIISGSHLTYLSKPFSREPRSRTWNLRAKEFNIAARVPNTNCPQTLTVCRYDRVDFLGACVGKWMSQWIESHLYSFIMGSPRAVWAEI